MKYPIIQSLAFLKIQSDIQKNSIFLDNFIPFVIGSLKKHKDNRVNISSLQEIIKSEFTITIPQNVIKGILNRAKKRGYLSIDKGDFVKNNQMISEFSFYTTQNKVVQIYNSVIAGLIKYAQEKFAVQIFETEAENLLISFISYYQIKFYEAAASTESGLPNIKKLTENQKFIIASFILNAKNLDHEIYESLDIIVKGFLISQVLYLPDVFETRKKFNKTKVFFDTSFIIYALGYSGPEYEAPCSELLQLLYENDANLFCFEHTFEEIEGILFACSHKLGKYSPTPFGRTVRYFDSIGDTPFDIKLKISHLRKNIENLNIRIVDTPDYSDEQSIEGEKELFDILQAKMPNQHDVCAIERDVASLSATYRLRKNRLAFSIEDSYALFVTTNNGLMLGSNEYFYKYHDNESAPPCVTDYFLTNILWLKTPNLAPELPMKRIIADAYAAIQPSDSLMEKWNQEVDKISKGEPVTQEDYYFMRSSDEVFSELMDHTLGDPKALSSTTTKIILDAARENIRKQVKDHYSPIITENQKSIFELQRIITDESKKRERKDDLRKTRSKQMAKILSSLIAIPFIIIEIGVVLLSLPYSYVFKDNPFFTSISGFPAIISRILFTCSAVFLVGSYHYGYSINLLLRKLEVFLQKKIYSAFLSIEEKL